MKYSILLIFAFFVIGCSPTNYSYVLEKPTPTYAMNFRDSIINSYFQIDRTSIIFKLTNRSKEPIRVLWNDASIIQNGISQKIMHNGIKYLDRSGIQPPTVIPASASIDDSATPIDNVYYASGQYGGWKTHNLIGSKKPNEAIGNIISLYLPIQSGGKTLDYTFDFKVSGLQSK